MKEGVLPAFLTSLREGAEGKELVQELSSALTVTI